jgi:adenine-specific DNA-methyltransferase
MKNRLEVAKRLLADDGLLFISIDDNEYAYLKILCDEVFGTSKGGRSNFIATICQKSRAGISNDKIISNNHNYLLFYAKNHDIIHEQRKKFGIKRSEQDKKKFTRDDNDGKGKYTLNPVTGPGGDRKGNPYYEFLGIKNYWRFSEERMKKMYDEGRIVKINTNLYQKTYWKDIAGNRKKISTWWKDVGTTSQGTNELKRLFEKSSANDVFSNPKPVNLIKYILEFCNLSEGYIVDFFAGSGTTAHAVLEKNKEDGTNLKFILIEQMDYIEDITSKRIQSVIRELYPAVKGKKKSESTKLGNFIHENTDSTEKIKKNINLEQSDHSNSNQSFIYFELKEFNQKIIDKIDAIQSINEVPPIWELMKEHYILKYQVSSREVDQNLYSLLGSGNLSEIKEILIELLNKNHLYVNLSEMNDQTFEVSEIEKNLSLNFYK